MAASDRRVHRRIEPANLPAPARVSIAESLGVSLVDLSAGGALLELPFQLRPDGPITLTVSTPAENFEVPFHPLRCYVAGVDGRGVRYHAAGAFEHALTLPSLAIEATPSPLDRLVATLETFLRTAPPAGRPITGVDFHLLTRWVIDSLNRGEPARLIVIKIKAHLARQFPSMAIRPASDLSSRDARNSARFFGYDFRSRDALSRADRRVLRAGAHMIHVLEKYEREATALNSPLDINGAPLILHTIADWQLYKQTA